MNYRIRNESREKIRKILGFTMNQAPAISSASCWQQIAGASMLKQSKEEVKQRHLTENNNEQLLLN